MKYSEAISQAMEELSENKNTVFVGYNILYGSKAYGTLSNVHKEMCIETPVAENLMIGLALGLALEGFRPVVFFERHDFLLNALDGIVNHLDKFESLSGKQYQTPVIIRAVIGAKEPLYPGPQHVQDFTHVLKKMVTFPVIELNTTEDVIKGYKKAKLINSPIMFVERRELYDSIK